MSGLAAEDVLDLHRRLVAIPSVSGDETAIGDFLTAWLTERGAVVERIERNLLVRAPASRGAADLLFLSHLDTVPPSPGWTRAPWQVETIDGRVFGLGSNDAKASVAAMCAAFVDRLRAAGAGSLDLLLVADEETGGRGAELVLPELSRRGETPRAAVVGEPTGLDLAVAQKGLMILELEEEGDACHAAHARARGARNALLALARDLVVLESRSVGDDHPLLGPVTVTPTLAEAGTVKNRVPDRARAVLDVRTTPGTSAPALVARLQEGLTGQIKVRSSRLEARATPSGAPLLALMESLRPAARRFGSPTMSDWVWLGEVPSVKCGPGATERSHAADEWVHEDEVLEAHRFYRDLAAAWVPHRKEDGHGQALGQG